MNNLSEVGRIQGLRQGTVIENADPDGVLRVRVRVEGVTERSAWARPLGVAGGGSAERGGWVVPDVGADVAVQFLDGDPERPFYQCLGYRRPAAGTELPAPAKDVPPNEAHQVPTLQLMGGRLSVYVDEREGQRKVVVLDNVLADSIVWDLEEGGLRVKMTSGILLNADGLFRADALQCQIGNRFVDVGPKPI